MNDSLKLSSLANCRIKHLPIKRLFDILFSLCVLSFGAPVFVLIAALVRLTSQGPAIYSHERIGRGGKPFPCYKFRSMYKDADVRLHELLTQHPELKEEWEANHKLRQDPRITPIGAFLRKTSLDELPQFWNVLKGDLSVVGPRPVVKAEIEKFYGEKAAHILSVRPGLTGIWQVSGRSDTGYLARIAMDEEYLAKQSFSFDCKLILLTVPRMLFSKGAY